MNAWEQARTSVEDRAKATWLGLEFNAGPDDGKQYERDVALIASAIRAAEASATERERERCHGIAIAAVEEYRRKAKANSRGLNHFASATYHAYAAAAGNIATRINQGERE